MARLWSPKGAIAVCAKRHQWQMAVQMMEAMQKAQLVPTAVTWGNLSANQQELAVFGWQLRVLLDNAWCHTFMLSSKQIVWFEIWILSASTSLNLLACAAAYSEGIPPISLDGDVKSSNSLVQSSAYRLMQKRVNYFQR